MALCECCQRHVRGKACERDARVRHAQYLLENSDHPIERIAVQAGFGSATAFRERFKRVTGTTPQTYRATWKATTSDRTRSAPD